MKRILVVMLLVFCLTVPAVAIVEIPNEMPVFDPGDGPRHDDPGDGPILMPSWIWTALFGIP